MKYTFSVLILLSFFAAFAKACAGHSDIFSGLGDGLSNTGSQGDFSISGLSFSEETSLSLQDGSSSRGRRESWRFQAGSGFIVSNNYRGADTIRFLPIPFFDIRYNQFFFNPGQGIGVEGGKRNGPWFYGGSLALAPQFGNRDASDIPGLPEVNFGLEARLSTRFGFGPFTVQATAAESLFGTGHKGATLDISLRYGGRFDRAGFWGIGPGIRLISNDVANAFYDVRPEDSAASGLPVFDTDGGLETVTIGGILVRQLSERWTLTLIGEAGLLVGSYRNSPVTETRFQSSIVTAIAYQF